METCRAKPPCLVWMKSNPQIFVSSPHQRFHLAISHRALEHPEAAVRVNPTDAAFAQLALRRLDPGSNLIGCFNVVHFDVDHANPELVVAMAGKPICASTRAVPTSHGFGMTKVPEECRRWNSATRSSCTVMPHLLDQAASRSL